MLSFQQNLARNIDAEPKYDCSFTEPNSIMQGCLDAMSNPGSSAIIAASGIGITGTMEAIKGINPIAGAAIGFAGTAAATCAAGALDTALTNCKSTYAPIVSDPVQVMPPILAPLEPLPQIEPMGLDSSPH